MATLNTPGPGSDDGGQVVSLDAARTAHPGPDTPPGPGPDTPPDNDGPVLEGEVVRVDQPGPDRADWLADLAARTKDRRPIIHPALRSRARGRRHRPVGRCPLPAREPVSPGPGAQVRRRSWPSARPAASPAPSPG